MKQEWQDPNFKTFKTFIYMGAEMAEINPMFSYYVKTHGIQLAYAVFKKLDPKHQQYKVLQIKYLQKKILQESINQWLKEVEKIKSTNKLIFLSKEDNLKQIQDYITEIFFQADDNERAGQKNMDLARLFFVCAKFIEVLQSFGASADDIILNERSSSYNLFQNRSLLQIQDPLIIRILGFNCRNKFYFDFNYLKVKFDDIPDDNNSQIHKPYSSHISQISAQTNKQTNIGQNKMMCNTVMVPQSSKQITQPQTQRIQPDFNSSQIVDFANLSLQQQSCQQPQNISMTKTQDYNPGIQQTQKINNPASNNLSQSNYEQSQYFKIMDNDEKIMYYTKDAISELDFKKYSAAKNDIQNALNYLQTKK